MAIFEKTIRNKNFDKLLRKLENEIPDSSWSADLEAGSDFKEGDARCSVRVFERYSMMGGNRLSLTLTTSLPKLNKLKPSTERRAKKRPPLLFCRRLKSRTNCVSMAQDLRAVSSALWHCTRPSQTALSVPRHWQKSMASVGTPTIIWMAAEALSTTTGEEWNSTTIPTTRNSS